MKVLVLTHDKSIDLFCSVSRVGENLQLTMQSRNSSKLSFETNSANCTPLSPVTFSYYSAICLSDL